MAKTLNDLWIDMLTKEGIAPTANKTINDMLYEMLQSGLLGRKGIVQSGQQTSYQDGDDGYYKKGLPVSGARFLDLGKGIIKDLETGLEWVKEPQLIIPGAVGVHATNQIQAAKGNWANNTAYVAGDLAKDTVGSTYWVCVVPHTSHAAVYTFAQDRADNPTYWRQTVWTGSAANLTTAVGMNWSNALINSEALEYAGHTDWRLPNVKELQSIVDYSTFSPAINATFFPHTVSAYYWSGTTYAIDTSYAWIVNFNVGSVSNGAKALDYFVRPVRSSQ